VQTVLVLKDILRRFPDVAAPYAATLQTLPHADLQTDEAAAAFFWIRAEMAAQGVPDAEGVEPARTFLCYAASMPLQIASRALRPVAQLSVAHWRSVEHHACTRCPCSQCHKFNVRNELQDGCGQAAYVFEEFADKWADLPCLSKVELLFATARVALVAAPLTAPVLKKVLFLGLKDGDLGVLDAARVIHAAFAAGIEQARALLTSAAAAAPAADDHTGAVLAELSKEFNTLAVVYERPARTFVDRSAHALRPVPAVMAEGPVDTGDSDVAEGDFMEESAEAQLLDLSFGDDESMADGSTAGTASASGAAADAGAGAGGMDAFDALSGLGGGAPAPAPAGSASDLTGFDQLGSGADNGGLDELGSVADSSYPGLDPDAEISKDAFAAEWAELAGASEDVKLALPWDKPMALMTQEPRPFAALHAAVAGDHLKARSSLFRCACIVWQSMLACCRCSHACITPLPAGHHFKGLKDNFTRALDLVLLRTGCLSVASLQQDQLKMFVRAAEAHAHAGGRMHGDAKHSQRQRERC
jgi:hypothetical protein